MLKSHWTWHCHMTFVEARDLTKHFLLLFIVICNKNNHEINKLFFSLWQKMICNLFAENLLCIHQVPEVLRCSIKNNTFLVTEAVAELGKDIILDWFDSALNINGPNSAHRQKWPCNFKIEYLGLGK